MMGTIGVSKNKHYDRGVALYDRGLYSEAITEFEHVNESVLEEGAPERRLASFYMCEAYANLGLVHLHMNMHRRAEEELKAALLIHPEYADLHFYLAVIYYRQARYDEAEPLFGKALAINPKFARALIYLGLARLCKGNEDGLADIAKAVTIEPAYKDERYEGALSLYSEGDRDRFRQLIEEVAETDVDQISGLLEKGVKLLKHKSYQEAVNVFLDAIAICPHYADLRHYLGFCYVRLGMIDLAIEQFRKALDMNPAFIAARVDLASAYGEAGDQELAVRELKHVLDLYPGHPDATRLLSRFQQ